MRKKLNNLANSGRSSQFSFTEKICILKKYKAAKSTLTNKFSDYNVNNKAWTTTTEKIYSVNWSNRTVKDIQKRFKNMVQEVQVIKYSSEKTQQQEEDQLIELEWPNGIQV